jgi:hypothetical protein
MRHMFDGFAMVAKFRVVGGQVWASQRFLNTQAYTAYKQQGVFVVWMRLVCRCKAVHTRARPHNSTLAPPPPPPPHTHTHTQTRTHTTRPRGVPRV